MRAVYRRPPATRYAHRGPGRPSFDDGEGANTINEVIRCARCGKVFTFALEYSRDLQGRTVCRIKDNCFLPTPGGSK